MPLPKEKEKEYVKRILESRLRILCNQGFYGSLLMHMNFAIDENVKNVAADRRKIYFNPTFLDSISNTELDFVMIHEVVHLSLRHNSRSKVVENKKIFYKAADIVANSNILKSLGMSEKHISLQGEVQEHQSPNKKEGYEFTVEELYEVLYEDMILSGGLGSKLNLDEDGNSIEEEYEGEYNQGFDDHSKWETEEDEGISDMEWEKYTLDATETMYIRDPSNSRGLIPGYALRAYKEFKEAKVDWRTLINNFIQEDVNDYTLMPPDRRFSDSPFFLPDFNDRDETVKNVLFMIDTSGSMSDSQITTAYSEVKGAIDQFGGKLEGWLGFFDAAIIEPKPFTNVEELEIIKPYGGGGTSFSIVFSYIKEKMEDKNISSIIILTDGYAPWPDEEMSMGIPTIWLINNNEQTPPWGKVARLTDENKKQLS